jgi:glycosyltransferase involved in cell wall biosynthesis
MQRILQERGCDARIFTPNADAGLRVEAVRNLPQFLRSGADILIYHYAVAYPEALEYWRSLPCRKILKYHNVTPPEFFEPYHAGYADLCRRGRDTVRALVAVKPDLLLGDSHYNVQDLIEYGAPVERCTVLPPFHAIEDLQNLPADLNVLQRFGADSLRAVRNILMVGRIVPNKGYEHLIRSFALYRERYDQHCRLILAGKEEDPLALYSGHLRRVVRDLDLRDAVVFTGRLSAAALKACYLSADLFAVQSEHEGFCVPLIEAMAFGVPIVALARGAVGETLGDSGIVWDENDPALFAASFYRLLSDADLAWEFGQRGRARYENQFHNSRIRAGFERAIAPLCQ